MGNGTVRAEEKDEEFSTPEIESTVLVCLFIVRTAHHKTRFRPDCQWGLLPVAI